MNTDEKKVMVAGVAALCEAFNRKPSAATYKAYEWGLDGLTVDQLNQAFSRSLRETRKFMPSPAELRELAGEKTSSDRALLAWQVVLENLHLGPYKHVDFSDNPLINATIRNLGGWPTFLGRFTDEDAEKWVRKEFIDTYQRLANANVNGTACDALPGLSTGTVELIEGERVELPPPVYVVAESEVRVRLADKRRPELREEPPRLLEMKKP